jgi:FkbM family methyltransferase
MTNMSSNRLAEAASIFLANPISASTFAFDELLGRTGRTHRIRFRDITLRVRPRTPDLRVVRSCMLGEFDHVIGRTGCRNGFILDIGGYLGLVAILFARAFPNSQIVCLEPSRENFLLTKENCAPYSNIETLNCAIAPFSGEATLRDRGTGQWGFTIVEQSADRQTAKVIEKVRTVTVEELMKRWNKTGIDLVKLDIEGGEYPLLKERPEWVTHTDVLVAEIHDRIQPGASAAFELATAGRLEVQLDGEKRMSIALDAPGALGPIR